MSFLMILHIEVPKKEREREGVGGGGGEKLDFPIAPFQT